MYQSYGMACSKESEVELLESARATSLLLAKLGGVIKSRRFKSWFEQKTSYLPWVTPVLFKRLHKDLMFQVRQCHGTSRNLSDYDNLSALAVEMLEVANQIEESFNLAIKKADKHLTVRRDSGLADEIVSLFISAKKFGLFKENRFYLFNALDSLFIYALSRRTLEKKTGVACFDNKLISMSESYLLDGYPHDLLAHDALSFAAGGKIEYWLFNNEYCATHLVFEGGCIPVTTGYKCIPVKKLLKKAA